MAAPSPLIEVANMNEADLLCEQLRAAGIKCGAAEVSTASDSLAWMGVGRGNLAATAIKVFVDEADIPRAEELLARWDAEFKQGD